MNSTANVTTWGVGDYPLMACRLEPAAAAAVEFAGVRPGDRVLDVATGTGNAALLAAERGAQVVGVDFEPALLQVAGQRARDAGIEATWLIGDATSLPVPDGSADVALSVFGAMYASDHEAAARELARAVPSQGRVVLAAWTPGSVMPAMGQAVSQYLPPPPAGSGPPSRWGDLDALMALLEPCGLHVRNTSTRRVTLEFPSANAAVDFLIQTAGHIVIEQDRLVQEGRWKALHLDLSTFVQDKATQVGGHLHLALDYLLVVATKTQDGADTK